MATGETNETIVGKIQALLREYQNNFKEVPVLHTMVTQLLREVDGIAPQADDAPPSSKQDDCYDSIVAILPYRLWPRMLLE